MLNRSLTEVAILSNFLVRLWRRYRQPRQIVVSRVSPAPPPPYEERVKTPEFLK